MKQQRFFILLLFFLLMPFMCEGVNRIVPPPGTGARICIVGASPDQGEEAGTNWNQRWRNIAANYDVTFIDKRLDTEKIATDFIAIPTMKLSIYEIYETRNLNLHTNIWKQDLDNLFFLFSIMNRLNSIRGPFEKFDLVISDYSVTKDFTPNTFYNLLHLIKPTGKCVLGPLTKGYSFFIANGKSIQALKEIASYPPFSLDFSFTLINQNGERKICSINIGTTEEEKNSILEAVETTTIPQDQKRELKEAINKAFQKERPETVIESWKRQENNLRGSKFWSKHSLMSNYDVKFEIKNFKDIQQEVNQILDAESRYHSDPNDKWIIMSLVPKTK